MSLAKLQAAYRKGLNKSTKQSQNIKKKKVVSIKKAAKHKDAIKISNRKSQMDFK
ncbi:MAG: hypothetical protein ABS882_04065 [Lysinibacillus sp.]